MTIKSDKWIKRQALHNNLITPFFDGSINTNAFGEKIPSYGVSSYGYDIRLGRNFKFFKDQKVYDQYLTQGKVKLSRCLNPQGAVLYEMNKRREDGGVVVSDTKEHVFENYDKAFIDVSKFDPDAYTEINDVEAIILPPHSFTLAHSEERIKVPRDVSVVCMGKSTIARTGIIVIVTPLEAEWCFTGDTEVALANGESVSFKDMVERVDNGERFFGYTFKEDGTIGIEELLNPRKTRENTELVEVTLDSGETIKCTPDHKFLTKYNGYVEAQNLKENDSLMALYRYSDKKGYESVASPVLNKTRPTLTHKLSDQWNIENGVYEHVEDTVRHHVDFNPQNNYPTNIVRMTDEEHHRIHETKEGYKEERIQIGHLGIKGLFEKFRKKAEKDFMRFEEVAKEHFSKAAKSFWSDDTHEEIRVGWLKAHKEPRPYALKAFDQKLIWNAFLKYGSVSAAAKSLQTKADTIFRRFPQMVAEARDQGIIPTNHKVVSVKKLDYKEDVYCLTVPKTHNFALEAGVFVHNCGFITLEITNTTGIPVRLETGIGITQLQFFQSDEECEVSYADRDGKYQNQGKEPVSGMN